MAGVFFALQISGCLLMFENKNDQKQTNKTINDEEGDEEKPILIKSKINSLGLE